MAFVVFAGQSNTGGYQSHPAPPPPWSPDPKILIWDAAAAAWRPMQPGVNTGYPNFPNTWGPEVQFALAFRAAYPDEVLRIVKHAEGGTRLGLDPALWAYDWSPESEHELFDRVTELVRQASQAAGGERPDAVFWGQGEEDATRADLAETYGQNLQQLFAAIRAEWMGDGHGKIGFFQIGKAPPFSEAVRRGERYVDDLDPDAASFDTAGFPMQGDSLHYAPEGFRLIGSEYFRLYAGWQESTAHLPLPVARAVDNILRVPLGDPSVAGLTADLAAKLSNGQLTEAAAVAAIVRAADATTSVATLTYQFFTGRIPTAEGIEYLVAPDGPNASSINSAYYQRFSLENRYINFAVNLGKLGEGRESFVGSYGALSLEDATAKAYETIFGGAPGRAKVAAILEASFDLSGRTLTRAEYFAAYGGDGVNGLGAKAAMVGWLLAEAEKADLGVYARSNAAFLADLADGASFSVDLVGVYAREDYAYTPA
jgi:hypothetical protein